MRTLLSIFAIAAIGGVIYMNMSGTCPLSAAVGASDEKAASGASTVSTEPQPNVPAGWITDYSAALAQAKAENKPVFIDFTGSDWCGWCIKLDKEVLSQPAFEDYAKKNLVRLYLDFPNGKPQSETLETQNKELAKKYGIQGFPTIVVLSPEGKTLGEMGYQRGGPEAFIKSLEKLTKQAN